MSIRKGLMRLLAFGVPVLAAAALLVFGLNLREPPKQTPPSERSTAVRVLTIKPTEFKPRAIGYGAVQPPRTWNAVAQVAGRVEFVEPRLRSGAIMDAGTEIIRISPQDYTLGGPRGRSQSALGRGKTRGVEGRRGQRPAFTRDRAAVSRHQAKGFGKEKRARPARHR